MDQDQPSTTPLSSPNVAQVTQSSVPRAPSRKIFIATGVLLLLAVIGTGWYVYGGKGAIEGSQTIRIVGSFPLQKITVGQGIVNGITLAFEEAHYTAGKFTIVFDSKDDGDSSGKWQESIERSNAEAAVADPNTMLYLGPFNSGAAKISIPITNKGGLVQLSPGNTWPGLTQPGFLPGEPGMFYPTGVRTYFRVSPTDALQGPAGAVWAHELGAKTVYVLDDGDAYGVGIADLFQKRATELGIVVMGRQKVDSKTDFKALLASFGKKPPDLIYFGGTTPNGIVGLAQAVYDAKLATKIMGPDGIMEQAFIDQAGKAADGIYVTVVGVPATELKTPEGIAFEKAYKARFGIEPETFSIFGYESAKVALLAIERAGVKDRSKILNEISKIQNYSGLFGTWSFDQNGDTSLDLVSGSIVHNGAFEFKELLPTH